MKKKTELLLTVYRRLSSEYGPQHWWPADTPFEVMVGAILTQSAAWSNVEKAIGNLKLANAMSPPTLRKLPTAVIAGLIYPSGYYNAKATKLKALVQWLGEICGDDNERLQRVDTTILRHWLLSVHGIGPETADSILLYAIGKPVFVVDTYTRRILTRLGMAPEKNTYDAYQRLVMDNLEADRVLFNEYHALLVKLGKEVCRTRPLCGRCCLFDICSSNKAR